MLSILLVVGYIADIQASALLVFFMLRTERVTTARSALITFFGANAAWAAMALHWELSARSNVPNVVAWVLPVSAVIVSSTSIMARSLEDRRWHPSRRNLLLAALYPAVATAVAATPAWHGFIVTVDSSGHASYAIGFWVHAAVSCAIVATVAGRHVRGRSEIRGLSGYSASYAFLPWLLPVVAIGITVLHEGPRGPDFTPIAFLATVVYIGRSMIKDGLADIVPIARGHVFESFADAIFVVDSSWCIVDANAKALRLVGEERGAADIVGIPFEALSPVVSRMCEFDGERDVELDGHRFVMGVRRSPLKDMKGRTVGALVHVRDITVDVLQRRELERVSDSLAEEAMVNEKLRAELAEQVVRDADTGLRNRRFVFAELPVIADGCWREGVPISIVLLDVDRFKAVNDTYGHSAGDRTLEAVAVALESAAEGALVARFGGEEFMLLLPGATNEEAVLKAEALRDACASIAVPTREGSIVVTLSAGVATALPGSMDVAALIDRADAALYDAKEGGRNRVCSYAIPAAVAL